MRCRLAPEEPQERIPLFAERAQALPCVPLEDSLGIMPT
jgi:hypothetical protein